MNAALQETGGDPAAIRPFRVNVPEAELDDLRRRIAATRWPDRETVADTSQGVQLKTMRSLANHWAAHYDWRKCEARLNALPQFITTIDGLDIHFIHVRSKHADALLPRAGPRRKPLTINRKACSSRQCRNWQAIGQKITTGASAKRN